MGCERRMKRTSLALDEPLSEEAVEAQALINMEGEVFGVVMAKLNAVKMVKWTGDLPQNVNYAIKVPYLTGLLSSAPTNHSIKTLNMKLIEDIAAQISDSILLVVAE